MYDLKMLNVSHVVIACCTYKRPKQLLRLLESLCELDFPKNIKTEILIVDNDKEKGAERIVEQFKDKLPIDYILEEQKGLSNVRNKALKEAIARKASHIAFIDDDEIADKKWIVNHIDFYNNYDGIYISSGPTYKKFDGEYPDYIVKNRIFKVRSKKINGKIRPTCPSGNVFFPLEAVKSNNIYFSEDFNSSGGEDTDFFSKLSEAGFTIGWNFNAVNYEIVGSERANLKWIFKRAFNSGQISSLVRLKKSNRPFKRFLYITEKFVINILYIFLIILSVFTGTTNFINKLTTFILNFGKIHGAIFYKPSSYYKK